MRHRTGRRPAAWLALVAMLAALALPAHALPARAASASPGGDLCVGGKSVPASPSQAQVAHACDACCGSPAAAPPRASADAPVVAVVPARVGAGNVAPAIVPDGRLALARGPPARGEASG